MLTVAASPSLFGEAKVVVVEGAESATDALVADVVDYVPVADPATTVVVVHGGGVRGKRMLDAIKGSGAPVVAVEAIKKDSDKVAFVNAEFRRARRRIDASGVRALVEALGNDLRELAAACSQLVTDTDGTVSEAVVDRYYGGRVEATGFRVADAAGADAVVIAGDSVEATNPKVVRSTAGSLFHLPVVSGVPVEDAVAALRGAGLTVLAADGAGDLDLDDLQDAAARATDGTTPAGADLRAPTAWLFGNEAWGLPAADRERADAVVRVPLRGRAESLNLGTAAAVCLYASSRAHR